jgi:hypothetical protein
VCNFIRGGARKLCESLGEGDTGAKADTAMAAAAVLAVTETRMEDI